MTRWEYHWIRVPLYGETVTYDLDTLDGLGRDGWEAWSQSQHGTYMIVHLKRREADRPPEDE